MTTRKRALIAGAALVVVLVLTGLAISQRSDRGPEVRTEEVVRRDLVSTITATGYIQPKRKVDISADISGRVTELRVEEGQWVERGAVLLRIDPTSYEANVRRATASVSQARAQAAQSRASVIRSRSNLERSEQLAGSQNLISNADLEQARTDVMVAEAQLEAAEHGVAQAEASLSEAREQLRKTTIVAPMTGQVTRLNIEEGETAVVGTMNNPGSLLLTVADLSEMEARVRVTETDIPGIHHGDSASVRIDAYPDREFPGEVTRIANSALSDPSAVQQTGGNQTQQAVDFEVIVTLNAPPEELRPDLTATAEIVTATRTGALAVPIVSVTVRDPEGKLFRSDDLSDVADETEEVEGVFVLEDGEPVWRPVTVGIVGEWYFEVVDGLTGGETIVAGPYATIRDLEPGDAVRVVESEAPAGEATS